MIKIFRNQTNSEKLLIVLFFFFVTIEVISELLLYRPFLYIFKPLISLSLMVLYWHTSSRKNIAFFLIVAFLMIAGEFFIEKTERMLFMGLIAFSIHRILTILYIIKSERIKDYFPLFLAMIPFLFFFFYLLTILEEFPKRTYYILIIQIILVSILGGITVSGYIMNYNRKNTWLLIFGMLSVFHTFMTYIEKYYFFNLSFVIFRPIVMLLNAAVYYTFYKFFIESERLDNN